MKRGKSPAGKAYWPAFPYPAFTQMTEQDLGHLWAWLQTLEPVSTPNRNHDTRRTRLELGMWRMLGFKRGGRSCASLSKASCALQYSYRSSFP